MKSHLLNRVSSDTFSPELEFLQFNWVAACPLFDGLDDQNRDWRYTFNRAECTSHPNGHSRNVKIVCYSYYQEIPGYQIWQDQDLTLFRLCPVGARCMPTFFINSGPGGPHENPVCADEKDVVQ